MNANIPQLLKKMICGTCTLEYEHLCSMSVEICVRNVWRKWMHRWNNSTEWIQMSEHFSE
jgi:hypothetical protein